MSVVARERSMPPRATEAVEPLEGRAPGARRGMRTAIGLASLTIAPLLLGGQRLRTWYWIDEALTVGIAQHGIPSIPGVLAKDGSPPIYYLLLAAWTRVFGTSELATHSLSLVIGLAIVPVAFWAANRLFDRRAAWFSATFAGLSPFVAYFAAETRMYELVVLESIVLCATFSMAFIERRPRGGYWFALSAAALVYTHYWGFYALAGAAIAVLCLARQSSHREQLWRSALVGFGGAAVLFLPWLPTFVQQVTSTGAPWSHTPTLRGLVGELAALVRDERVLLVLVLAVGAGIAPLTRELVHRRWRVPLTVEVAKALAIVLIGVTPVAIGWGLAHVQPSWATRYLAVCVGPMILLVGVGLSRARGLGTVALVIAALLIVQPFTRISPGIGIPKASKSNARVVAEVFKGALPAGSLVLVSQPEAVPLFEYYLGANLRYADPRGPVSDPTVMDWRDAEANLDASRVPGPLSSELSALRPGDRLLLVSPATAVADTDTSWIQRFKSLDREWQRFLQRETCLKPLRYTAASSEQSNAAFRGALYQCQ